MKLIEIIIFYALAAQQVRAFPVAVAIRISNQLIQFDALGNTQYCNEQNSIRIEESSIWASIEGHKCKQISKYINDSLNSDSALGVQIFFKPGFGSGATKWRLIDRITEPTAIIRPFSPAFFTHRDDVLEIFYSCSVEVEETSQPTLINYEALNKKLQESYKPTNVDVSVIIPDISQDFSEDSLKIQGTLITTHTWEFPKIVLYEYQSDPPLLQMELHEDSVLKYKGELLKGATVFMRVVDVCTNTAFWARLYAYNLFVVKRLGQKWLLGFELGMKPFQADIWLHIKVNQETRTATFKIRNAFIIESEHKMVVKLTKCPSYYLTHSSDGIHPDNWKAGLGPNPRWIIESAELNFGNEKYETVRTVKISQTNLTSIDLSLRLELTFKHVEGTIFWK